MRPTRSYLLVVSCLLLSMAGFACGDSGPQDSTVSTVTTPAGGRDLSATNILTNEDIRSTKPRTPERRVVEWAQAVQFGDIAAVRASYTPRVRALVSDERFDAASDRVSSALGKPEFVRPIFFRGSFALVRVRLVSFGADGTRNEQPATFRLRKENGRWLLDDASLLLDTAAALQRLNR